MKSLFNTCVPLSFTAHLTTTEQLCTSDMSDRLVYYGTYEDQSVNSISLILPLRREERIVQLVYSLDHKPSAIPRHGYQTLKKISHTYMEKIKV